jgi:PQQ-dependent dehydrogenase (methanol/ethanol family)
VQNQVFGAWQSNPLIVDGMMYVTQRPNDVMAIDARTGKMFWLYRYTPSPDARVCCGANNRGVAILGDTLYLGTLDAHLIALDARSGKPLWNVEVGDVKLAYSITMMPLIVKDKVVVGVGGGEFGIRGYVAAYDAKTGKEAWKFYTIPAPGEPHNDSWPGDSWKSGAGSVWVTGSFDPDLNLTYWGVGNPGPDWNPDQRKGDNLYTDSVVALDADTGKLKWHFQFTPNDAYDYDSVQVPVLADIQWQGKPRKVMMWANRNGYFYVLDRATGEFLLGRPFVKVNWASALDAKGRPVQTPQPFGSPTWPGNQGATNWYPPSFSPRTGLFYVSAWENYATIYRKEEATYQPGRNFSGGGFTVLSPTPGAPTVGIGRRSPIQQLDRRSRQRRDDRHRPADRSAQVEVHPVRRQRLGHHDDGVRPVVHRRARRVLLRARRARRQAAVESQPGRPDRDGAGHLYGGQQAVRVGHLGTHARHLRAARLRKKQARNHENTKACFGSSISFRVSVLVFAAFSQLPGHPITRLLNHNRRSADADHQPARIAHDPPAFDRRRRRQNHSVAHCPSCDILTAP